MGFFWYDSLNECSNNIITHSQFLLKASLNVKLVLINIFKLQFFFHNIYTGIILFYKLNLISLIIPFHNLLIEFLKDHYSVYLIKSTSKTIIHNQN